MSERKRRKIMLDWGRWQTILKKVGSRTKPAVISVYVALENVCFEQRLERGGNVCVASAPFIASMAGVHEDTVEHHVHLLEEIGVVRIKQIYDVRKKQYHENHYTLLLTGGRTDRLGVADVDSTSESPALSKEKGGHQNATAADAASTLTLRHFDVPLLKDIEAAQVAKREAAAKYKAEQLAEAEERKRQEEAELAERKERERLEREQQLERLRLATEKEKADKEAAQLAEDARRLARRTDVASCVAEIRSASFDDWDPGNLQCSVYSKFDRQTFYKALERVPAEVSDLARLCMKNNAWLFDDAPEKLTTPAAGDHAADHTRDHVSDDPRSPSTV